MPPKTRSKRKQGDKYQSLPDPIAEGKDARSRVKSICAYTTAKGKIRKELFKSSKAQRARACDFKKGDVYVCNYTRRNPSGGNPIRVKNHCRGKARR